MSEPKRYILQNHLSPGDVLCMAAAIYSIQRQYPDQYEFAVDTSANEFYEHSPDVKPLAQARAEGWEQRQVTYDAINVSNQVGLHMMDAFCRTFSNWWGVPVPLLCNRPPVYLTDEEKAWLPQVHEVVGKPVKYWTICSGVKSCYTTKGWGTQHYQEVVDRLRGRVLFVQIGSGDPTHRHPPLKNVIDLRGKTDLRQLTRLCHHAEGGVGGVTLLMHLTAAVEKPYMCLLGGREPVPWNAYPLQQTFHVIGALPCCKDGGCWRSRVVPLHDNDGKDQSLCEFPVPLDGEHIPRCMALIRSPEVAEKILLFQP